MDRWTNEGTLSPGHSPSGALRATGRCGKANTSVFLFSLNQRNAHREWTGASGQTPGLGWAWRRGDKRGEFAQTHRRGSGLRLAGTSASIRKLLSKKG